MSINITDLMVEASNNFDTLCQERHKKGQEEYGSFTFLGNDVVRMMMEELADTANYCRMQFIKLLLLQQALEEEVTDKLGNSDDSITIGVKAFKGTGETGWLKNG